MRLTSVVTRKGQVTIPVEVRKVLGLKEGDRVAFEVEKQGKAIRIERQGSVAQRTRGMFKSDLPSMTAEEMRLAAEVAMAEESVRRSGS